MKILHLVGGDLNGGAARGAYWLHQGLVNMGVKSKILTNSKTTLNDPAVESIIKNGYQNVLNSFRSRIDALPAKLYFKREKKIFSPSVIGYDFTKHPLFSWADIIHFHWVNQGFTNIKDFSKVKKPMIWTLRDMWPFTGGCHYSMNCKNYEIGCGQCVQLNSKSKNDLSRFVINRKRKYIPHNVILVCVSKWLEKCASKSMLFKDYEIKMISNNINTQEFYPIKKKSARELLGLPQNSKIVLAGAQNINDYYKGFGKLLEAIKIITTKKNVDIYVVFFGNLDNSISHSLPFKFKSFGYITNSASLRLLYSASDVFVAPSLFDAFGKTLAEAMACGTPVVCFDTSGPKDIVDHKKNGYLAKPYQSSDLAKGIEWVLENVSQEELSQNAIRKVLEQFDIGIVAEKYIRLYEEVLKAKI